MLTRRTVAAAVAALALGVAATQAASSFWINHLSFSGPFSLPGVTLGAGTYTFEADPLDVNPSVVRVLTRDRRRVLYTGFTTPVARPRGRVPTVVFGEVPAGRAMPIRVWYPTHGRIGYQFQY